MAIAAAIFVSKRLQRAAAALLCLTLAQMTITLSSCHPEAIAPMAARVHIGR
ncbi:MAG: hypothetical protein WDM92_09260 [Caulobacteraceae bacterium]